jgi:putative oxidoreductase
MIPERFSTTVYGLFRLVFGFSFLLHGLQKWGLVGGQAIGFDQGLISGAKIIEPVCGILIMIGLFTRPAAFVAAGQMAVAYFVVHFGPNGGWPIQNGGELAVLYCFAFLYIASRGGGYASIDSMLARARK